MPLPRFYFFFGAAFLALPFAVFLAGNIFSSGFYVCYLLYLYFVDLGLKNITKLNIVLEIKRDCGECRNEQIGNSCGSDA